MRREFARVRIGGPSAGVATLRGDRPPRRARIRRADERCGIPGRGRGFRPHGPDDPHDGEPDHDEQHLDDDHDDPAGHEEGGPGQAGPRLPRPSRSTRPRPPDRPSCARPACSFRTTRSSPRPKSSRSSGRRSQLISSRQAALVRAIATYEKKLAELRAARKHEEGERQRARGRDVPGPVLRLAARCHRRSRPGRGTRAVPRRRGRRRGARAHPATSTRDEKTTSDRLTAARAEKGPGRQAAHRARSHRVNRLLEKLADSSGVITLIDGVLTYVPTGPSPVALWPTRPTSSSRA